MQCVRCGYCCQHFLVAIVDNPSLGLIEGNIICNEGKKPCKHLSGDKPGEFSCAVHDYPWYKETPCYEFGQLEKEDSKCRLGEYVLLHYKKS